MVISLQCERGVRMQDVQIKHEDLGLSNEDVLAMFETMLMARRLDERMWLLNRSGKIPFVISCQGQEAAQVGAALHSIKRRIILHHIIVIWALFYILV